MNTNIVNLDPRRRLLTPNDIARVLGISRDNAMRIMRIGGMKLGSRWYISQQKLNDTLDKMQERS